VSSTRLILFVISSTALAQNPIPATFFGMSAVQGDYPKVSFGTLAHQGFAWETIEQTKGTFNFKTFDNYMAAAQQHGLVDNATNTANFAMTLAAGTPGWAVADKSTCSTGSAGLTVCTAPPDNIQDWKDFVTAVIQHYNGKAQPHIRYYELWNEFNVDLWWTGTDAQLVALAQAAYPIIRQDGNSILLTPSVAGAAGTVQPNSSVNRMTGYLQAGGSKYADGGAFHGYLGAQGITPFPMPEQDTSGNCKVFVGCYGSIMTKSTQMRAVFDQNGLAGQPMYQTEGSWGNENVTDLDTQVAWVARFNLLQAGLRATLNLQLAAWFTWGGGTSFGWGDIEDDSLNPTAAGVAYTQVYNWVVGASINQPCSGDANGTWTCRLTRTGGYAAQAVWNTQGTTTYSPGAAYTQYRDLAGNTTPIKSGASVTIGAKPILIEAPPPAAAGPAITLVANAEGEVPLVAPNTWIEIKGSNLAPAGDTRIWQGSDFINNQMPTQLDGVKVTVNGKSAFVYYISPTQVNVLTPPDAMQGAVQVQLTNGQAASPAVTVQAQAVSPSFFIFGAGPYVAAEHSNGSYLGPATLYPGQTTPAKPGETIVLFANGFGPTSLPIVGGSPTQGGTIAPLPTVTIGGLNATVTFAGLIFPGEFQLNVVVPSALADGDHAIIAYINGASTQPGALLTVQGAAAAPGIAYTLSPVSTFATHADLAGYGFSFGPSDGQFGAIPGAGGTYTFYGDAGGAATCVGSPGVNGEYSFTGTLDRITGSNGCKRLFGPGSAPAGWVFDQNYAGGGQVVPFSSGGKTGYLIPFHGEYWWQNPNTPTHKCDVPGGNGSQVNCFYSSLGLAVSTDNGKTFQVAGQLLQPSQPLSIFTGGGTNMNVGYGSLVVADAGGKHLSNPPPDPTQAYFYLFYTDYLPGLAGPCANVPCIGVARAVYADVVTAALSGDPHQVARVFHKYDGGSPDPWTQPATSDTPDLSGTAGKFAPLWTDDAGGQPEVIYDAAFDLYLAVHQTSAGLAARASTDLIHWSGPIGPAFSEPGHTLYYVTILGENGDPNTAGTAPRIYFSSFPTGQFPDYTTAVFESVTLNLSRQ